MNALIAAVAGIGYMLVYAAVANGGVFATQPWLSLVDDAYSYKRKIDSSTGAAGFVKDAEQVLEPILFPGLSIGKKLLGGLLP